MNDEEYEWRMLMNGMKRKQKNNENIDLISNIKRIHFSNHQIETKSKQHSNIISTSSWRIGEALVKKELVDFQGDIKHSQPFKNNSNNEPRASHQLTSKPQIKKTECHLIETTSAESTKSVPKLKHDEIKQSKIRNNLNDIQKYMQNQKKKRLQENKLNEENAKQKLIEEKERRRKLRELHEKQRKEHPTSKTILF